LVSARAGAGQQQDLAPVVAGLSVLGAVAAAVLGWGGAPVAVAGLVLAGNMASPPLLTGRKDRAGMATPAHDGEAGKVRTFRMWRDLRWRLLVPNTDWLPGWPVRLVWPAGLLAGAVAGVLPTAPTAPSWLSAVNALCATVLVWQVTGSRRRTAAAQDPCPGIRVDALTAWAGEDRRGFWLNVAAAFAVGTVPAGAVLLLVPASVFASFAGTGRVVVASALGAAVGVAVLWPTWSKRSLQQWRDLVATRAAWGPRWTAAGCKDESPVLVSHETVGPLTIDTFDAPPAMGSVGFANGSMAAKVLPAFGAASRVWTLSSPNLDSQGQPVVGSVHPVRVRVVHCPSDQVPDLSDPSVGRDVAEVVLAAAMGAACDLSGVSRYLLEQAEPVTVAGGREPDDEEDASGAGSPWTVWASTWTNPDGLDGGYLRWTVKGALAGQLNLPVLVDHRASGGQGVVFVGPATDERVVLDETSGASAAAMLDLEREDEWRGRWGAVLKQGVNAPKPELSLYAEDRLVTDRGSVTVYSQPFVTLSGEDPAQYRNLEGKLKATLRGAPFVAVTGYAGQGDRRGERHAQAFVVTWAYDAVPSGPQSLPPQPPAGAAAATHVLGGRFNDAFVAARLARPEVTEATCLTARSSTRRHIWRVGLRLHDGVTLSDVRGMSERIRGSLGSPWLRIEPSPEGCTVYAGALPRTAELARPAHDMPKLVALDWEQAFNDSKVSGVGGQLPVLRGTSNLPHNEQVQVLDFDLPPGVASSDVRAAVEKLKTATENAFIDVRAGTGGASTIRLLVCRDNPLPTSVPFAFDVVDEQEDGIPFATGVEGEPVVFYPKDSPHALLAGVTGAGKSVLAQAFLYGFLVQGAELYVVDPIKGGADFAFAKDHARAFATTAFEAAGVLKVVYAEVVRRKTLNAQYGASSYLDLPPEVRPPHLVVLIDEFTSLLQAEPVPPPSDDPELDADRDLVVALNYAKATVGTHTGKLAREARSAGVTLLLGTQKLSAKMLDAVPGGGDLKDLALDTRLPVPVSERFPDGWAVNADLQIGDLLYACDGTLTPIVGFSDTFTESQTYRVTFDDGQSVVAGAEHLWLASNGRSRISRSRFGEKSATARLMAVADAARALAERTPVGTLASAQHIAALVGSSGRRVRDFALSAGLDVMVLDGFGRAHPLDRRTRVPSRAGRHGPELFDVAEVAFRLASRIYADVGADGHEFGTGQVVSTREMAEHLRASWAIAAAAPIQGPISPLPVDPYVLGARLGVLDDEQIPAAYLRASVDQRIALLQGLMDTGGTVMRSGACSIGLTSERLADGVHELVVSLGVKASRARRQDGATVHTVTFAAPFAAFRLPRKVSKQNLVTGARARSRYISSIEPVPSVPTRCIAVEHPSHLFLVEGFVPTHNTNLARSLLGKASNGDRMSALRAFDEAPPVTGDIPKGRGLWEPLTSSAQLVQVWYAPQATLREQLLARRPALTPQERLDVSAFRAPSRDGEPAGAAPVVIDLGTDDLTWDDLAEFMDDGTDDEDEDGPDDGVLGSDEPAQGAAVLVLAGALDVPGLVTVRPDKPDDPAAADRFGRWQIAAVDDWLASRPSVRRLVWVDDGWDDLDELGVSFADTARDVLAARGVEALLLEADGLGPQDEVRAAEFCGVHGPGTGRWTGSGRSEPTEPSWTEPVDQRSEPTEPSWTEPVDQPGEPTEPPWTEPVQTDRPTSPEPVPAPRTEPAPVPAVDRPRPPRSYSDEW
jgi:hypothetical protein